MTLWCLFCNISPNDKLFIMLDCCFSCLLDVAESYYFVLGVLFPLSNGRITGPLVSFEAIGILIIFRHSIGGVWWFGVIGWGKSVDDTNG